MACLPTSWMTFSQDFRRKICLRKNLQKRPLSCLLFVNSWAVSLTVTQFCLPDTTLSFVCFFGEMIEVTVTRCHFISPSVPTPAQILAERSMPEFILLLNLRFENKLVRQKWTFCLTSWKCRHFPEWPMTHSWKSLHFNLRQTKPLTFCQGFSLSVLACSPAGQAQTDRQKQTHTQSDRRLMRRASGCCCTFAVYLKYLWHRLSCLPSFWHFLFLWRTHRQTHTNTQRNTKSVTDTVCCFMWSWQLFPMVDDSEIVRRMHCHTAA